MTGARGWATTPAAAAPTCRAIRWGVAGVSPSPRMERLQGRGDDEAYAAVANSEREVAMYLRFVHLQVREGQEAAFTRFYQERAIPALAATEGCLFAGLLAPWRGESHQS